MVSEVVEIIEKKNNSFVSYAAGSLSLNCWMESGAYFNILCEVGLGKKESMKNDRDLLDMRCS